MNSKILFLFLLQATINVFNLAIAQRQQQIFRCRDTGDFSSPSLRKNRDSALDYLASHVVGTKYTGYLYTRSSSGKKGEQVDAVILCSPIIKAEDCQRCVKKTVPYLINNCNNKKEGVAWTLESNFIGCMVRYAESEFQRKYDCWAALAFSSADKSARPADLTAVVSGLGVSLAEQAIRGDALKYASGKRTYGSDKSVYMASQCTPDLTVDMCYRCLNDVGANLQKYSKLGHIRVRSLCNNCYTRYNHVPITQTIDSLAPSSPSSESTTWMFNTTDLDVQYN